MQTTALESAHIALGARMVPFAGWNMPVQYRGILDEAKTVREHAGLFDLGHMGRVKVYGPQAEAFLQRLQTIVDEGQQVIDDDYEEAGAVNAVSSARP